MIHIVTEFGLSFSRFSNWGPYKKEFDTILDNLQDIRTRLIDKVGDESGSQGKMQQINKARDFLLEVTKFSFGLKSKILELNQDDLLTQEVTLMFQFKSEWIMLGWQKDIWNSCNI